MLALVPALAFAAVIGSGLMAGLFFVFSVCIMQALARLPAEQGVATMNAINVVIQNPLFFAAFMGTALLGVILIAAAFIWDGQGSYLLAVSGLVYLVGTFGSRSSSMSRSTTRSPTRLRSRPPPKSGSSAT